MARDELTDLPGLARFGDELAAAARREDARARRRRRPDASGLAVLVAALVGVGGTAAATLAALRATVIPAPDARVVPADQRPLAGTQALAAPRAADPAGGPPWALRLTRSQTGQTCTTVGQVKDEGFGIVGRDGVFRAIPDGVADSCGDGLLVGARIVSAATPRDVRSIVYGVAGEGTRAVTLTTTAGTQRLALGARGTFVAALRGYPEDTAARVAVTGADGRVTGHPLGVHDGLVPDIDGAPAWRVQRLAVGPYKACALMMDARGPDDVRLQSTDANGGRAALPTTCIDRRTGTAWAAAATALRPGSHHDGRGAHAWTYRGRPPRTIVLGTARTRGAVRRVVVLGAGAPRTVTPTPSGAFAVVLPASARVRALRLRVTLASGRVETGRPGHGTVPLPQPIRRKR